MEIGECTTSSSQSIRWNSPPFYDPQAIDFAEHAVQDYTWLRIHDIHVFRLLPDTLTRYPHVFEERKRGLETAKALDPHDIGRWPRWKLFHSQRSTAIVSVKNVSNDNPDNITALFLHEQLYQRLNSKMQAQAAYMRIIDAKNPKFADKERPIGSVGSLDFEKEEKLQVSRSRVWFQFNDNDWQHSSSSSSCSHLCLLQWLWSSAYGL